jgi:spoIIIJ-associated protein
MSRVLEKTAKTVSEAIELALGELGLAIGDVEVEVLDEGKSAIFGLLGGKMAKVRVTAPDSQQRGVGSDGDDNGEYGAGGTDGDAPEAGAEGGGGDGGYGAYGGDGGAQSERRGGGEAAGARAGAGEGFAEGGEDIENDEYGEDDEDGESGGYPPPDLRADARRVMEFLDELFRGVHVTVQMEAEERENGVAISISSEDSGILIGHRGETLDAFQYLANLFINKGREVYIRVSLDIEDYRKKREDTLVKLAERAAEKVIRLRRNMTLDPMNSYERHVVHTALQSNPRIETHSVGEEPNRKIVVSLKNRGGYYQSQRRF